MAFSMQLYSLGSCSSRLDALNVLFIVMQDRAHEASSCHGKCQGRFWLAGTCLLEVSCCVRGAALAYILADRPSVRSLVHGQPSGSEEPFLFYGLTHR